MPLNNSYAQNISSPTKHEGALQQCKSGVSFTGHGGYPENELAVKDYGLGPPQAVVATVAALAMCPGGNVFNPHEPMETPDNY